MTQHIGFIGLGLMGQAMASHVLQQGYSLTIYNRTREKTTPLQQAGATVADTPAAVAKVSDVIILMLTGEQAVDAVLHGDDGILATDGHGKTIINMSTVPPTCSKKWANRLAERGITMIDAPVSGSKVAAEQKTLIILAGGEHACVQKYEPLLLCMGKKVIYCGEAGRGSSMKLAINLLLGTMMEGLAEATHLAECSGLSTETFLDVVASGPLSCGLFQLKEPMFKSNHFPPQFPFKHMAKDLQFILRAADETCATLPLAGSLAKCFSPDAPAPLQEQDFAAVKTALHPTKKHL